MSGLEMVCAAAIENGRGVDSRVVVAEEGEEEEEEEGEVAMGAADDLAPLAAIVGRLAAMERAALGNRDRTASSL